MLRPASQQSVNSVTIQAQGTGDEHVDGQAVNLYADKNGNGQVDSRDSLVASSAFAANDGASPNVWAAASHSRCFRRPSCPPCRGASARWGRS